MSICRGAADDPAPAVTRPAAPRYRFLFFARFLMKAPGRRYDCSVAEARRALAELPQAREWMHFAWLTGGSWMPGDDDEVAADEGECRRELLREALGWAVGLWRARLGAPP
jgi:hypothetical protein